MGHQSVVQKSDKKKTVCGTVEMGHQSVDKIWFFQYNDFRRFFGFLFAFHNVLAILYIVEAKYQKWKGSFYD